MRRRRGSSKPTTAHHFPRLLRSATASTSHASGCGLPQTENTPSAAKPTESNSSTSTLGRRHPHHVHNTWRWDTTDLKLVRPSRL